MQTILCLGKNGDIATALPIAKELSKKGAVQFVVSKEFLPILDGCSYLKPILWQGDYSRQRDCLAWLKRHGIKPVVAQSYNHPDSSHDLPYQKDAYRIAGFLNKWGTLPPPLFDKRDPVRETELIERFPVGKPWIGVHLEGISSPIPHLAGLIDELSRTYPQYHFIDLAKTKAHRVFDMIGLLDVCDLLVSVDSIYLHLSRAAKVPVIAVVNNTDAWRASVPPPATIRSFGYKAVTTADLVQAVGDFVDRKRPKLYHAASIFGQEDRHYTAYLSWKKLRDRGMICCYWGRVGQEMFDDGNGRLLPFLKDVLHPAIQKAKDHDIILWCNSDIELKPEIMDYAIDHCSIYVAASFRRDDAHIGRDGFAFSKKWLNDNWDELGDYVLGAPVFDLAIASLIKYKLGIIPTLSNSTTDFHPADSDRRYLKHQNHTEGWSDGSPAAIHNSAIFNNWLQANNLNFWNS